MTPWSRSGKKLSFHKTYPWYYANNPQPQFFYTNTDYVFCLKMYTLKELSLQFGSVTSTLFLQKLSNTLNFLLVQQYKNFYLEDWGYVLGYTNGSTLKQALEIFLAYIVDSSSKRPLSSIMNPKRLHNRFFQNCALFLVLLSHHSKITKYCSPYVKKKFSMM